MVDSIHSPGRGERPGKPPTLPTLITISYRLHGEACELHRIELGTKEEKATDKALEGFKERCTYDSNSQLDASEQEITHELMREAYPDRADLIVAVGRLYALSDVAAGARAIPVGKDQKEWRASIDVFDHHLDEWIGEYTPEERATFFESYLSNLFLESDSCDPVEE